MTMQRQVKITRDATGDTIGIPEEFALSSDDVVIRKDGDRLVIEPVTDIRRVNEARIALLATLDPMPPGETFEPISRAGRTRPASR